MTVLSTVLVDPVDLTVAPRIFRVYCIRRSPNRLSDEMPHLDELHLDEYRQGFATRCKSAWDAFCDFAFRDNVLEVAVGLM